MQALSPARRGASFDAAHRRRGRRLASFAECRRREAAIAKRLDQQDRRLVRLEHDVGIAVETLALFIRFWLTTTPPLPEPAAKAARAQAGTRYDNFVTALGCRLNQGPKLRQEIPEYVDERRSEV
jgi:hypothetical protein